MSRPAPKTMRRMTAAPSARCEHPVHDHRFTVRRRFLSAHVRFHRNRRAYGTNRNTNGNASGTLGGALGSFISASTAGRMKCTRCIPSFARVSGSHEIKEGIEVMPKSLMTTAMRQQQRILACFAGNGSMYQQSLQRASDRCRPVSTERRRTDRDSSSATTTPMEDWTSRTRTESPLSEATIHQSMESGNRGLSDAHGGHQRRKRGRQ
jgi:hypothetical protein